MRKVCAPKTALRAEGIDNTPNQRVKSRKRVSFVDVTGQCRNFYRDISNRAILITSSTAESNGLPRNAVLSPI
jgi:hypothetical protein